MTRMWGFHLALDCSNCNDNRKNPSELKAWLQELVQDIDMIPYGEPQILHFGHNEEHLEGWTALQFIETSNILAHFNDHTGEGYIDIFSCKEFNTDVAIACVKRWFDPSSIRVTFLTRQA